MAQALSRNNPWAREGECPRKDCPPCWGRRWLAVQEEKEAMENVTGKAARKEGEEDQPIGKKGKVKNNDKIALPCCTKESINYTLECITCRLEGKKATYIGETSRSPYQRGREHSSDID